MNNQNIDLAAFEANHFFTRPNGDRATLPFSQNEYDNRLAGLRKIMADNDIEAVLFTSMHNIAYYSGFLYTAFGRPYGLVVTMDRAVTLSANIDAGQPWRWSHTENIIYTDWKRNNYYRAAASVIGNAKSLGLEFDHINLAARELVDEMIGVKTIRDIAPLVMRQRMVKSTEEIALIREGSRVADIGGYAIHNAIRAGAREIDVAMAGRNAMELEIAASHPNSEIRDNWVWFQSGINTDGAHNPVTTRALRKGDILSLNCFPMISAYYTALERTMFLGEPNARERDLWEINIGAHELGISLIKPGVKCSDICHEINRFFASHNVLQYRSFGYGHSFGVLSHYYGREAGLELREDIHTVLEPGMVISMEPMLWIPEGTNGAGGYREHDILVIGENGAENITKYPYGPEQNIIGA